MRHPLEFILVEYRKRLFFVFLFLTLVIFGMFQRLDQPLRTSAVPAGIVSFELAGDVLTARAILESGQQASQLLSATAGQANSQIVNVPFVYAAFGLGFDYLFMPVYALALGLGTLLAANRHAGWLRSLGSAAGYGALAAPLFDAVENYALFQILEGRVFSPYPELAATCASVKFGLLIFGLVIAVVAGLWPPSK